MTAIAHLPTVVRDWHRMGESAAASAKGGPQDPISFLCVEAAAHRVDYGAGLMRRPGQGFDHLVARLRGVMRTLWAMAQFMKPGM